MRSAAGASATVADVFPAWYRMHKLLSVLGDLQPSNAGGTADDVATSARRMHVEQPLNDAEQRQHNHFLRTVGHPAGGWFGRQQNTMSRPPPFPAELLEEGETCADRVLFELERRVGRDLLPAVQHALAGLMARKGGLPEDGAAEPEALDE